LYYRRLRELIRDVVLGHVPPRALRRFAAQQVRRGIPIDPSILQAPDEVLATEARFLCLALPSLRSLHADARAWLAQRLRKPAGEVAPSIAWNMALGGQRIAPADGGEA